MLQGQEIETKGRLVELEKSLLVAKNLSCGKPLVRSLLSCICKHYGQLEESRVVNQYGLGDYLKV